MKPIQVIAVEGLPIVKAGDSIGRLVCDAARAQGAPVQDGDILVVTHVFVSRAEGSVVNLDDVVPSVFAKSIAERCDKDPALVEVVLQEAREICRMGDGVLITETKHGFVCANSGVDRSNVPGERNVVLLPTDPDKSAEKIRREVKESTGCDVAVVVSDTHGRPFRHGEINVAIGVAGMKAVRDRRGERDLFGYVLRVKQTAVADEVASAAELVIGQADEGVPVAIVRGYDYLRSDTGGVTVLLRPKEKDLFR